MTVLLLSKIIRPSEEIKKLPLLKVQEEVYVYTVLSSSRYE